MVGTVQAHLCPPYAPRYFSLRRLHAIRYQDRGRDPDRPRGVAEAERGFVPDIGHCGRFSGKHRPALRRRFGHAISVAHRSADPDLRCRPGGADPRALERALARDVKPAVYTEDMFKT